MPTEALNPVRAWVSDVDGGTYLDVARQGDADNFGPLTAGIGASTLIGQEFTGAVYAVYQCHLEFDLTTFSVEEDNGGIHTVDTVEFSWDMTDFTDTQTWTARMRQNTWGAEGPSDNIHIGSGGMASKPQLCHWTMADPADDPDAGEAWTLDSAVDIINALLATPIVEGGSLLLKVSVMSARQQTELVPADNESFLGIIDDATLTIKTNQAVFGGDSLIIVPAPTLDAVVKPKVSTSITVPAPTLSVGNMTGPVRPTVPIPAPTLAATTIRRYNRDELFGFIPDDGRRIGAVV